MQRKSKRFVLLIAGIVGLVGLIAVLILNSPSNDLVRVTLRSYTNGFATIGMTNQTAFSFRYTAIVEYKIDGKWPEPPSNPLRLWGLEAHANKFSTLRVKADVPSCSWRISIFCTQPPLQTKSVRYRTGVWCENHGFFKVSRKLLRKDGPLQISTQEVAQISSVNKN
jgi:hypothetical protein